MSTRATILLAAAAIHLAGVVHADICDYAPSRLAGKTATAIGSAMTGGSPAANLGLQAVGYYTLLHSGSGLTLLGTTAAGASAAGTAGIIAGAGSALGSAGAILMAPAALVVGGVTIIGAGAFEGLCYFQVDRVTDPYQVRAIIESVASWDDAVSIVSTADGDAMALRVLGETKTYLLRKLYIADGQLKHRDLGFNTNLGPILFASDPIEE